MRKFNKLVFIALVFTSLFTFTSAAIKMNSNNSIKSEKTFTVKTETVKYLSGNDTVSAYLAVPKGKGKFPALIVIHEWWGLTPWMKGNAETFAKKGYVALAIDLYRGKVTADPKVAGELAQSLPMEREITDLKSAFAYLKNLPEVNAKKIGSIGWCFGGGFSFQCALNLPGLKTCVVNYGKLSSDENQIKNIHCPILCIFGNEDKAFPPATVNAFDKAAKAVGLNVKVKFYPGVGHAFMNPGNKMGYKKESADAAWKDIYAFLNKTLKK